MSLIPSKESFLGLFHLAAFSTLLGTQLFQSFINTKICYQALPRSAFTKLQKRLFPVYFKVQSILVLSTALTFPLGPLALLESPKDFLPFILAGITTCTNLFVFGPRTVAAMVRCIHQETTDKKNVLTAREASQEMRAYRKDFLRNHAMSIHLNLLTIGGIFLYGVRLAMRLDWGNS